MFKQLKYIAILSAALTSVTFANNIELTTPDSTKPVWHNLKNLPGAKYTVLSGNPDKKDFFVVRIKFPANFAIPAHFHTYNNHETVISGAIYIGEGKKEDKNNSYPITAGSFIKIPANLPHYGWTKEETILQVSGIGPWNAIYSAKKKA